ncbi:hypothetical protein DLAC_06566 [Tieghemostelium lacteum]|uniref:Ribosome recycling factor domain-containing protein n=1 Tax=Tieghemostelium lacteum TaxID=361077 RepID=A0A151ZF34_TIELA|nr:hypothetical protein DLAC_06566 [Tieghemostelium lacteum]|eukprot:KYQ92576.1 hypothetical protein DLAC_06566 [Tieghemostelium lacteum]
MIINNTLKFRNLNLKTLSSLNVTQGVIISNSIKSLNICLSGEITSLSTRSSRYYFSRSSTLSLLDNNSYNRAGKKGNDKKGGKEEVKYDSIKSIDLNPMKASCDKTIDFMNREYGNIRCGRASPELLERISVDTPSGNAFLTHIAMVTIKDALTLNITLYDNTLLPNVEKALKQSSLELNPQIQGTIIKVSLPKPTQDLRLKLVKTVNTLSDECKVSIRRHRKDALDMMKRYKLIKDDEQKLDKEIQKITDNYVQSITKTTDQKIKEINSS